MTISTQLPPPDNWQDFESLCCDLWQNIWGEAQRWGTSGEEQHGVDIYDPANGRAIQCKLKNQIRGARLKAEQIVAEIAKAEEFRPKLKLLIFATTSPRSVKDQETIAAIDEAQKRKRSFRVRLFAWDDIVQKLELYPDIKHRYYGTQSRPLQTPLPKLPEEFIARPDVVEAVTRAWRAGRARVGLRGMGGCGKTVLATSIAVSGEARRRFPDGVLWLTVGHSDPLALLSVLARYLTPTPPSLPDAIMGARIVQGLAAHRRLLLVLDDVWTEDQALALDVAGEGAGLLVTSRHSAVLERVGAESVDVEVLTDVQAGQLLERWGNEVEPAPAMASAIAAECGNLPLALAMAGAFARRPNRTWSDALSMLRGARLEKLETRFPSYPYPTLLAAIAVGVGDLEETARQRYLELAVFENEWVPVSTLATFWGDDDLVTTFVERSLAFLDDRKRMRLHDLQADYARVCAGDLAPLHRRLIDAFRAHVADGDFGNATDALNDGYFFQRLPHHLAAAGLHEELRRLLFDYRWLSAKLATTDANALIADYALVPADSAALSVRKALRLAAPALAKADHQLANQLLSRLTSGDEGVERLLAGARRWSVGRTWLRPTRPGLSPAGGCLQQTFDCGSSVMHLAYRGDGILDAFCHDGLVRQWDLEAGICVKTSAYEGDPPESEAVPEGLQLEWTDVWERLDDERVVVGKYGGNGRVLVWNLAAKVWECDLPGTDAGQAHEITAIAVLDKDRVVTGTYQRSIGLWNVRERRFVRLLSAHQEKLLALTRLDDNRFASGDRNGVICIWDVSPQALAQQVQRHSNTIRAIVPTQSAVVSTSYDDLLLRWKIDGEDPPLLIDDEVGWIVGLMSFNAERIAGLSVSGKLRVWDLDPPKTVAEVDYGGWTNAFAKIDGWTFVLGAGSELHVWDVRYVTLRRVPTGHRKSISSLAVLGPTIIATTSDDQSIRISDLEKQTEIARLQESGGSSCAVDDGRYLVFLTSNENRLRTWDWRANECFDLSTDAVQWRQVKARDQRVVCSTRSGNLMVFDVPSRTCTASISAEIHNFKEAQLAWLDDDRIVSGSSDGGVRVWNVRTGKCEATSFADGLIYMLEVRGDGRLIVAGDYAGNVQMLSFETA